MNYILDYFSDLLPNKEPHQIFHSFQNVQNQDPLSKLIKWLHTEGGSKIRIRSEEDILVEDFLVSDKRKLIQLNLDEKVSNNDREFSIFKTSRRNPSFPTEQQKLLLNELKTVPVYTVVNGNNEMILASPREQTNNNSLNWFYKQYYNWFIWKEDQGPITVGLFFLNKEDAESYLQEVCLEDPRGAQNLGLSIKNTGLDTFYYLNRTSNPTIQVRLISDLEELDKLLRNYINHNASFVNPKQKYGINWFKGTPIYTLRTDNLSEENEGSGNKRKKLVFFSKQDTEKFLQTCKQKNPNLKTAHISTEIYNLENYLLDLEKSPNKMVEKVKFFPPFLSYKNIVDNMEDTHTQSSDDKKIKKIITNKIKSVQRFCKGVVWLVTSDTLPSEENSW